MERLMITRRLTIPAVATLIMLMASSILFSTSIPLLAKRNQPLTGSPWSVVQSPNVGTSSNDLNGVAVVSSSNVWAVGEDNTNQALIEQWNGSTWNVVSSPAVGSEFNELLGVAAVSASDVWAVGSIGDGQTLIEQWNGSSWNIVPSPSPGSFDSLNAVAVVSANDIWAVGSYQSGSGGAQTLIEQWNGSTWNVVPSPDILNVDNLTSVAAVSANDVWAVGWATDTNGIYHTLIEQWNGSSWNVVSSPNPGSVSNSLNSVAVVSASNVWAVGDSSTFSSAQTLIEQWNGSSWNVVSSPSPGSYLNTLNSVASASSNDVWAVGYTRNSGGIPTTLTEQWNGSSWNVVSSPSPGSNNNALYSVAVVSSSEAWAVGSYTGSSLPQTLIEHNLSTPPQLLELSSDTYTNSTSQHKTEVEPDIFSFGSTIVAAFQVSRFGDHNGGSDNIGWVTSTDNGTTWSTPGLLPGITKIAGGTYDRASDPVVTYDAAHQTWMIVSIGIVILNGSIGGTAVLVSRSSDGLHWNTPVSVATSELFDKPWITCDNTTSSPYYGHCYIEWDDGAEIGGNLIVMATSANGGTNWVQTLTADKAQGLGGQPLVQPNGNVVVPYESLAGKIAAFESTNGGTNWGTSVTVAQIQTHTAMAGFRTEPLPSAAIDGSGKVYVVWQDCRFESNCSANDIVMSTSTNGTTWSASPKRLLRDPVGSGIDHFIPGLAVDKSTSGSTAHLVLVFYYYPVANCSTNCQLDVGFASSTNGGSNWTAKTRLAGPMTLAWLAKAPTIKPSTCSPNCWMVGDYISATFSGGNAYPVFAVAKAPSGGVLNEAMYTVVGGLS